MTHRIDTYPAGLPATGSRPGGNIASLKRILSTGNLRAAAAMVFAGIACMWTCVLQRAAGQAALRRHQVLLLASQAPHLQALPHTSRWG